jgi:uncharacterized membrane protein SpoIIM required for sporulation
MDLDAYSAAHRAEWDRLALLASKRKLTGRESDELIELYQSTSAHLAEIKATVGETIQGDHMSLALAKARIRFTGTPANPLRTVTLFFVNQLPAALYRVRWLSLAITVVFFLIATLYGLWVYYAPGVLDMVGTEASRREYAETLFVEYYSESSTGGFASQVWTNNAWITAQMVMFGITGVFVPYNIWINASNLGIAGAIMAEFDRTDVFFLYLAPHGQLELYSIFVAGAAGLMIFWSWVAPGARTRRQALAEDGRAFFTIVIGLALSLLLSGLIEGFVTGRDWWPWPVKIGLGTLALVLFLLYQWVVGRRAARAGETGDVEEFDAGATQIVAV